MTWESFYLICFLVGFLLSFVSFLAQAGHFHLPGAHAHGGDLHIGHAHGGDLHADAAIHAASAAGEAASVEEALNGLMSKLNFSTITAFLAWFGGTGYLIERYTSIWTLVAFALASLSGIAGAAIVFWFLAKLAARDRTLDPADFDLIGMLGHVSSTVYKGGTGEMIFTQDGVRKSAPIRSEDGSPIDKGEEVVITKYERGVGYVRRWSDLAGMAAGQ
jgi:membrane protein implicated in regulation of membrane protease activity